ncbi:MAG: DUF1385 domain-containing protein [Nanoarchaeota archaeon]|nr:DUF1385 domain-containing protein [Nanoarchaeota archaeon]
MRIGGQAVIEGVMMKSDSSMAIGMRDGKDIKIIGKRLKPFSSRHRWARLPLVRGIVNLIEMLILGFRALNISASLASGEEKISGWSMFLTMAVSLVLAVLLFKFIPLSVAQLAVGSSKSSWTFALIDGLVKIAIFFLYVYFIRRFKDIRRVFEYHGAEHKTVHAFEAEQPLTVDSVKKFSTLHARCGTSFIALVLILSIVVYAFIPMETTLLTKLMLRLLFIPLIAGISYEIIRLEHRFRGNRIFYAVLWPGMLFQHLTTSEPDKKQLQVAIAALKRVKKMG